MTGAMEMMRDRAAEHGDTLVADVGDNPRFDTIMTDGMRVRQILVNLLAMPSNSQSTGPSFSRCPRAYPMAGQ